MPRGLLAGVVLAMGVVLAGCDLDGDRAVFRVDERGGTVLLAEGRGLLSHGDWFYPLGLLALLAVLLGASVLRALREKEQDALGWAQRRFAGAVLAAAFLLLGGLFHLDSERGQILVDRGAGTMTSSTWRWGKKERERSVAFSEVKAVCSLRWSGFDRYELLLKTILIELKDGETLEFEEVFPEKEAAQAARTIAEAMGVPWLLLEERWGRAGRCVPSRPAAR